MKARSRRLLRGLAGVVVGVSAIAMVKSSAVMAATGYSLSELNVGAAKVLDSMDRGTDVESSDGGSSEDSGDSDSDDPDEQKSDLVMANVKMSLNVREEPSE